MERKYTRKLIPQARALRKNMTPEERHLWYDYLRYYPVKFYKQRILGRYVADFYCAKAKLVIELDGNQHRLEDFERYDRERTAYLRENFGLTVIRFKNEDINSNFRDVCDYIDNVVHSRLKSRTGEDAEKGSPNLGELARRSRD